MKKYHLRVIGCDWISSVRADHFHTTTNGSTSSGFYAFYRDKELVACYPIERTIIEKIENVDA